jgi:hypothetical protein
MKRKKLKRRFGDITPSIFNKMSSRERQPIAKYNGMMDTIDKWYEEIEDYKHHIEQIEKDIRRYAKSCEKIYEKHKHLEEEYSAKFYFTTNKKVLSGGEMKIYWMLILKLKGSNKTIHLGADDKIKEVVKKEFNEDVQKMDKETFIDRLYALVRENLEEMIVKEKNLFDKKITLEDLIN